MGRKWEKLVRNFFKNIDDDEYDNNIYQPLLESSTSSSEILIANQIMFTLSELAKAANNFKAGCLIGKTDFGKVYKGRLKTTNQVVAIIDQHSRYVKEESDSEFLAQVSTFSRLEHPNIISLIGYCVDTDQRLLVNEHMPLGSLKDNLHGLGADKKKPLDWYTRMEIAAGVAKGLEYLHNRDVICQVLSSSNVLLDEDYHPKLSAFGFPSKSGPFGSVRDARSNFFCFPKIRSSSLEYCAPDWFFTLQFTSESDVYSFGVLLLEIITGKRAFDTTTRDRLLSTYFLPIEPISKLPRILRRIDESVLGPMADPMLQGQYPPLGLYEALALAKSCVHNDPDSRPRIAEVVQVMNSLALQKYEPATLIT